MIDRIFNFVAWIVVAFLLAPLIVIVGGSVTEKPYVNFPPTGFTLQWYRQLMERGDFLQSFIDSLLLALACTVVASVIGVMAALGLRRATFAGRQAFEAFVMSPLVLPTVISGVALLQFYFLVSMDLPFIGLLIGHVLITIPYVVRTVGGGLLGLDPAIEEAAESLGAHPLSILRKVTLPGIAPSLIASTIFVFITSFDQVTISIFLSSAERVPLPIRIYNYIDYSIDPMVAAVSTLLILFAFVVIAALERLLGLEKAFGAGGR